MVVRLACALAVFFNSFAFAKPVTIAVAANFKHTLELLAADFQRQTPQFNYRISSSSTGILYNQITHGAPFDLFFSADDVRPKQLLAAKLAKQEMAYAVGQLVFWAPSYVDVNGQKVTHRALWDNWQQMYAYANPKLAPYGFAAQQLAEQKDGDTKVVVANNVSQVFQFVSTGNIAAGFVARSIQTDFEGSYWLVPQGLHDGVVQHVALLSDQAQAIEFYKYLLSINAQTIITENGYLLPKT
ncbi:molybdate ABC transporter substrate-binding protein [Agarivorans aestuarii]|uniref:Molybdate ABC transporter substrate-binding protein n=1 Tax=Agarivorans aestuarii TaxID=1563703 RepID=A0ABU7G2E9_9ALTE|nr:molybdate ABC transporter substrate-binding protein [Agarivorans aestuarii]MEE1673159.1 molybdate ABC transporter substrate-binding protein [Agarivorans aestuarii]